MFGSCKIKLDKDLLSRAKVFASKAGYSSVEEFITHIIEREIAEPGSSKESEDEIKKRLEGLGYIF